MKKFLSVVTLPQLLAALAFVVGQAVAFGWLSSLKSQVVLSAGTTLITIAFQLANSYYHSSTVKAKAMVLAAGGTHESVRLLTED